MTRRPDAPLKIAILGSRGFPSTYGGFETLVRYLAPYLASRGHAVAVYCREGYRGLRPRTDTVAGVKRIFTPGLDTKSLSTLTYGITAATHAKLSNLDALIVLNVANGLYLPLMKGNNTKVIVNVDGLEWKRSKWGPLGQSVFKLGARETARHADTIIADSISMQSIWKQLLGRDSVFVPYGAEVMSNRPVSRISRLGLGPKQYLLVVARLAPENNVDLILDAYERVETRMPLVVVGSSNYENSTSLRLSSGVPNVCWLNHVSDQDLLTDLWAHCALYLHGHSVGGTNPALLQALGAGSPVLALDTPFNREVLQHPDQLFQENPKLLAEQLESLAVDRAWQDRVSQLGQLRVASSYRWDDVCAEYLRLCG